MKLKVENNKVVYVTYVLMDESDKVFEQSDLPIGYVHGSHKGLFIKLENALEGKTVGETVTVQLTPEDAFGYRDENLAFTDDIENVPEQFRYVGAQVQFQNESGEVRDFFVSKIEGQQLTVDGNHPLAGQTVTFKLTVMDIRNATPQELQDGEPASPMPTVH
jgi:FKBP-type peptidyl-prolyl cis-trans isomerase SlyD